MMKTSFILALAAAVGASAHLRAASHHKQCMSADEASSAMEYWTAERMDAAVAADGPSAPALDARSLADDKKTTNASPPSAGALKARYPAPVKTYPYSAMGKLFYTDSAGNNLYCTATFVSGNILVTGAACGYFNGAWNRNWIFYQQYDNGASSAKFPISCVTVNNAWMSTHSCDQAYAFAKTHTNTTAGHLGIYFQAPALGSSVQVAAYDGSNQNVMYYEYGNANAVVSGTYKVQYCDFNAIGAPVFASSYVWGVTSCNSGGATDISPAFDANTQSLFQYTITNCY